jgi:glutaredoxin-related protein
VLHSVHFKSVVTSDKTVYDVVTIERSMKNLTALSLLQMRLCQENLEGSKNKPYNAYACLYLHLNCLIGTILGFILLG